MKNKNKIKNWFDVKKDINQNVEIKVDENFNFTELLQQRKEAQLEEKFYFDLLDGQKNRSFISFLHTLEELFGAKHVQVLEDCRTHTYFRAYDTEHEVGYLIVVLYNYDLENCELKISVGTKKI